MMYAVNNDARSARVGSEDCAGHLPERRFKVRELGRYLRFLFLVANSHLTLDKVLVS